VPFILVSPQQAPSCKRSSASTTFIGCRGQSVWRLHESRFSHVAPAAQRGATDSCCNNGSSDR
jgi:hypothetical protein